MFTVCLCVWTRRVNTCFVRTEGVGLLITPWTKWPPFIAGDNFKCLFPELDIWDFDSNFTQVCSWVYN